MSGAVHIKSSSDFFAHFSEPSTAPFLAHTDSSPDLSAFIPQASHTSIATRNVLHGDGSKRKRSKRKPRVYSQGLHRNVASGGEEKGRIKLGYYRASIACGKRLVAHRLFDSPS